MTIEERIVKLERKNHLWRLAAVGLGLLLVAAAVTSCGNTDAKFSPQDAKSTSNTASAKGIPDVMRARSFEVVDDEGTPVVRLTDEELGGRIETRNAEGELVSVVSATEGGQGALWTYDGKGQPLVTIAATEDEGDVALTLSRKGKPVVNIASDVDGGTFSTFNGKGEPLVSIASMENGVGGALSLARKGQRSVGILSTEDGGALVALNSEEQPSVIIAATDNGGELTTCNGKGKPTVTLSNGSGRNGGGQIAVQNDQGQKVVAIGVTEEGSGGSIEVLNSRGKRVAFMQSSKTSCGLIVASDSDGNVRQGLTGEP